jgi:peptidoglycan hydrolase-like protein with peptidoglycan-binding domain
VIGVRPRRVASTERRPRERASRGFSLGRGLPAAIVAAVLILPAPAEAASGATGGTLPTPPPVPSRSLLSGSLGRVPLRQGMRGTAVQTLQRWLSAAGYRVPVDAYFGSRTKSAVQRFQRDHRLWTSGVVGALTARVLKQAVVSLTSPIPVLRGDVRTRIVAVAESQLGQAENPPGSNCTRFGPCEAWCADFATWVWRQAGVPAIGRIAWVPDLVVWGRQHRTWKPGYNNHPQPGDMVIFSNLHVGLVERVTTRTITIIAGNTSTNNVARRGPASPANGSSMGPAPISGYVSPITSTGTAATVTAASALPRPTAAQMAAQDPQDHDPRLAAQEH